MELPFYNALDKSKPKIWPNHTLLVPICAVGNVGQLACDLIISTLLSRQQCQLVGRLYSSALMSVVGPNAFSLDGPITTSAEVYESKPHKLVIVQQRTSHSKDYKQIYVQQLVNWIKESKFDKVIVLTSSFSQCNPDISQLGRSSPHTINSITTSQFELDDRWQQLDVKQIEKAQTIKMLQDGMSFLPGAGLTKPLIKAFEKASVAAAFLVNFCSEGINIQDCYASANVINRYILNLPTSDFVEETMSKMALEEDAGDRIVVDNKKPPAWVEPFSWSQY